MQHLGTDRTFVEGQYSDPDKLRIRIETHARYSRGETERIIDDCVAALDLSPGLRVLDVGCGAGSWHPRITTAGAVVVGVDLMAGMLREARAADLAIDPRPALVQADAQALPFAAASFDRVLCAGVLYHVPDGARALLEIRRVLRAGGRAIISTNGAYAMRRIYELHADAALELGYQPLPITPGHFTMDDLALVQQVFPVVERNVLSGALEFTTAEPALRFYATNRIDALRDRPADGSHRARLLPAMRERVEAVIEREGAFVVPKSVGFFTCTLAPPINETSVKSGQLRAGLAWVFPAFDGVLAASRDRERLAASAPVRCRWGERVSTVRSRCLHTRFQRGPCLI
jgi:SAM-dependent methyltransferase